MSAHPDNRTHKVRDSREASGAIAPKADEAGPRPPMQARYLAGLYELGPLGPQLRQQAAQVGMERAEVWLGRTDGGSGLEDFVRDNFGRPDLVLILDSWHPAEDLGELARLWHRGDDKAAEALAARWCHTMKHQGARPSWTS